MQDARIRSLCQQATLCLNITQDDFKLSGVQNGKKLLIILANSDPENPEEFSAPLFQAMVAAAMSHRVEVIFTGLSAVLAVAGHALMFSSIVLFMM